MLFSISGKTIIRNTKINISFSFFVCKRQQKFQPRSISHYYLRICHENNFRHRLTLIVQRSS